MTATMTAYFASLTQSFERQIGRLITRCIGWCMRWAWFMGPITYTLLAFKVFLGMSPWYVKLIELLIINVLLSTFWPVTWMYWILT